MITRFLFSSSEGDLSLTDKDLERSFLVSPSRPHAFLKLKDYFHTASAFLLEDNAATILQILHSKKKTFPHQDQIEKLLIRSEKQGALYHVASVEAAAETAFGKFALLAALNEQSRQAMEREYATLTALISRYPSCGLPNVYSRGDRTIACGNQKATLSFLLGEWLEGYHEWHISRDEAGREHLCVWDQEEGYYAAGEAFSFELFRQAARTLTMLFDPETACQVCSWNHAAGDFVVRHHSGDLSVRLTTVRRYAPLLSFPGHHSKAKLANLLFFFLDLGLKMHLDRLDGVGEMIWMKKDILPAVVQGFFEALNTPNDGRSWNNHKTSEFLALLRSFSRQELFSAFEPLLKIYREGEEQEVLLIHEQLPAHVERLSTLIEKLPVSNPVSRLKQPWRHSPGDLP